MNADNSLDEIWVFVEDKLQTQVPTYFKNVLHACGYSNGISISMIEAGDIACIEGEIRSGNVTKDFTETEEKAFLEGSTKNKDNFEFTMGHKKFLMFIVDFLKTYKAKHGLDRFTSGRVKLLKCKRKLKSSEDPTYAEHSKKKLKQSIFESAVESTEVPVINSLIVEKSKLLTKAITSLINYSPEMYVKACVKDYEMNQTKVTNGLVTLEVKEILYQNSSERTETFIATIVCPYCSKSIAVAHSTAERPNGVPSKPWWNTSNFDTHLKMHQYCFDVEPENKTTEILKSCHEAVVMASTQNSQGSNNVNNLEQSPLINGSFGGMLQVFLKSAQRHSSRNKHGYRHDDLTKMFAGYVKMIGGLLAYETLHANFPVSLPSVSTVNRFLCDNGPRVIEGEMRVDELLQYLKSRNMPLRISISEDGTRCTPKISYDPKTNQLVGFALPIGSNGMPIVSSFPARNVREIYQHYTNPSNFISSTAYVQMAQPTEPAGTSPFCLMMYATDNKFKALDVYRRWKFQAGKLSDKNIEINNIASDGDPRLLMAMKVLSRIGQPERSYLDCEWFDCGGYVKTTFTQDYVHIITKMRNRILKYSRIFPIADKVISSSYLKYLIDNVSKDKHLLTYSDIEPKDRQNFPSAEKVCSEKTMQCLLEYVPGSEGTVIYLKAMRSILSAFQTTQITSEERIYSIWYACFFARAWRSWILNSEKSKMSLKNKPKSYYNLKENFMSGNSYTCIELNAHALVKQALVDDESFNENQMQNSPYNGRIKYFFSSLFDSQVCESVFRQVRSFTSTFCTVVNFTILDIMNRIRKIQLQHEIIKASEGRIKFPRFERKADEMIKNNEHQRFNVLNRKTIIIHIEKAKDAVTEDLESLGVDVSKLDFHCQVQPAYEEDLPQFNTDLDCDSESDSEYENQDENPNENDVVSEDDIADNDDHNEFLEDVNFLAGITGELMLKDYTHGILKKFGNTESVSGSCQDDISLNEKSPLAVVVDSTGKSKVVRKSAVCYVLAKDKHKLSSDRLQRVQEKEYAVDQSRNRNLPSADNFVENDEISIGEWCVFPDCVEIENDAECLAEYESNYVVLGLVLGLTYLNGRTFKQREFTKSFASVESNILKPIGVMCDLYRFHKNGVMYSVSSDKHKFFKIDYYLGTIQPPINKNGRLTISQNLLFLLQSCLRVRGSELIMDLLTHVMFLVATKMIQVWRKLLYIFVYIRFKRIKSYVNKIINKAGVGPNGVAPHNIVVHNDSFYYRVACGNTLGLAEAYMDGWWDCKRLDEFFCKALKSGVYPKILYPWDKLIMYLNLYAFNLQNESRSQEVSNEHYSAGNDIFKCFLDKTMNYTCGYWKDAKNLDEAQLHKMDLICRKLKLKPGMRVLDLGCGWGGLSKFMAEKYDVTVVAVTNSEEGANEARIRCKGLQVDVRVHDYRKIDEKFDRIACIGLLEHVGRKNYRSFFKLVHRCLSDDGIILMHFIGHDNDKTPPAELFLLKYIFPNGILPNHRNIPEAIDNLFCIEDWHNFGPDYDKTLMAWNDNFVKNWHTISDKFENPEVTYRMWTYYFLMCAGLFRMRGAHLWQIVLTKGLEGGYVSVR